MEQGNDPDKAGHFIQWLYTQKEVYGFINDGPCIDIGSPETLEEARKSFK